MDIKVDKHTVIVFDLDDTLYNEIDYLKSAYKRIATQIDVKKSKSLYSAMFAMYRGGEDVFQFLSKKYNIDKKNLLNTYRNHTPEIYLFDGVFELLNAIIRKEGRLAIVTDGRVKTQTAKLEALGIKELFSKIVISEAIGSEKPNALNYKIVEEALPANNYVYVADNIKKDFVTPNALGWKTIGLIDNGLNIHVNLQSHVPDNYLPQDFIQSYADLNVI